MKKFLLILAAAMTIGTASARTYTVVVESLVEYRYIDNSTGRIVAEGTESPSQHRYTIDAPTRDMARNEAYEKCAGACNSMWTIQKYNTNVNGVDCRKEVRQIPNDSKVVE